MSELDDILTGLWGGEKFQNDRFEQDARVIITPEPLDDWEKKAAIIELMLKIIGKNDGIKGRDALRAEMRQKVNAL